MEATLTRNIALKKLEDKSSWARNAIWLYLWLVIFEGALRKWVLPSLSTPLLVLRDPIAAFIIIYTIKEGLFSPPPVLKIVWVICAAACTSTLIFGHQNLVVMLFGARVLLLHLPLVFVISTILNRQDIIGFYRLLVILAIPMTILIGLQFYSPQSAWVNQGVGGDEAGAGFSGAMGYMRPPGVFSFTNGTTLFYATVAPAILYFWTTKGKYLNLILLIAATVSLFLAVPLSISRALFFNLLLVVAFYLLTASFSPRRILSVLFMGSLMAVLYLILIDVPFVAQSVLVFTTRFDNANTSEGGVESVLMDRFLGGLWSAIVGSEELPLAGHGLGMGTNVGAMLLTGRVKFLISEGEWGRILGEIGPIMGLSVILIRMSLFISIAAQALRLLRKNNDLLPWLICSTGLIIVAQGGWNQPTDLGFFVLVTSALLTLIKPVDTLKQLQH